MFPTNIEIGAMEVFTISQDSRGPSGAHLIVASAGLVKEVLGVS